MTEGCPFRFAGEDFLARPSGALWWPAQGTLVVADLHLGRSGRYARRGGALLPPFEDADTLARLAAEIAALDPARVVSLGDAFDDDHAASEVATREAAVIARLADGRDWLWIAGNHDPAAARAHLPGTWLSHLPGLIAFRHIAADGPDISGHMHPSTRLAGRRFRCFVLGQTHLILPAFGTYTGGLDIGDPAFAPLATRGIALACAERVFALPMPTARKRSPLNTFSKEA
ncbi:ligase-associated DNA damage response endonuclease PdeM [Pseudogemmobacter humi]|uniref:Calcineurin-like phosphoesterase n=1 Tax=Pseudogemmobacter humi TaxID=2483812 RepID=A0A3P5X0C8_9RHOB|nr:ligase-associated DNA damage response endonuclease PdeM [Pseudogemmobacter humi]VDC24661.1 Calcineurin-like phosphoesterase [Pseudogemmobacter humi]